jgi:hypothetical protein
LSRIGNPKEGGYITELEGLAYGMRCRLGIKDGTILAGHVSGAASLGCEPPTVPLCI